MIPTSDSLPTDIQKIFLEEAVAQDELNARRQALLELLWQESWQTRPLLQARVNQRLQSECFGKQPHRAFTRDLVIVRRVLRMAGLALRFSRQKNKSGYYIPGRPEFSLRTRKKITASVADLSFEQTQIYARLSPEERVQQSAGLSDRLRELAARRLMNEDADLSWEQANRMALQRMYALDAG